ncbi:methylenetetrahydrofolate reductase [NAD(P)H] [Dehalococcoidia bacterium]|nr:methylenetetrahydrofolate reductase [NAD(P)H] [Dehalococcoidia bacterium]
MKIRNVLGTKRTLSFEYFPPRERSDIRSVFDAMETLKQYRPDFIDITYGAGGSTQALTVEMAVRARRETGLNVMAHITCSTQTREGIHNVLTQLEDEGIENLIVLRGDPPVDQSSFVPTHEGFTHATDLIRHVKKHFQFCVAAACYPESHPESPDIGSDMKFTRQKLDAGAEFLITQLFYNNDDFYSFMDRAARFHIDVPVIPGLMPIVSASQIRRITTLCGASIPPDLDTLLSEHSNDSSYVRQLGIDHTTAQAQDLLDNGARGLHFYVLNRSYSIIKILDNLRDSGHLKRLC